MKLVTLLSATALLLAPVAHAASDCAALRDAESLPKKYARVAPIYSDSQSGWIFTQDQLKERYDMKRSSVGLVTAIAEAFADRGVALAIVVAPPRPVIAGQARLDAAMGGAQYDVAAAQASFTALIAGLSETGAIVPDLQSLALGDPQLRDAFYFRRDTHWTTTGAAASASALAALTARKAPGLFPAAAGIPLTPVPGETLQEPGALAQILRDVCAQAPEVETAPLYDLARQTAVGLLEDTGDGPAIALVGSSFSNRNKRDAYRFGDALSRAFEADVANYSVSGGGPIGAIEAYVLSGALDRREHDLVIWELPYTESFNSASFLRQLLGALRLQNAEAAAHIMPSGGKSIEIPFGDAAPRGLQIVTRGLKEQNMRMEVRFDDGSKGKVSVQRRRSVPVEMRSPSLFSHLEFFGSKTPVALTLTPVKGAEIAEVRLFPG